jgi:hypothetical protein
LIITAGESILIWPTSATSNASAGLGCASRPPTDGAGLLPDRRRATIHRRLARTARSERGPPGLLIVCIFTAAAWPPPGCTPIDDSQRSGPPREAHTSLKPVEAAITDTGCRSAGTARHGTARHGTARPGTARHGTARHGTARIEPTLHAEAARRAPADSFRAPDGAVRATPLTTSRRARAGRRRPGWSCSIGEADLAVPMQGRDSAHRGARPASGDFRGPAALSWVRSPASVRSRDDCSSATAPRAAAIMRGPGAPPPGASDARFRPRPDPSVPLGRSGRSIAAGDLCLTCGRLAAAFA